MCDGAMECATLVSAAVDLAVKGEWEDVGYCTADWRAGGEGTALISGAVLVTVLIQTLTVITQSARVRYLSNFVISHQYSIMAAADCCWPPVPNESSRSSQSRVTNDAGTGNGGRK